MVDPFAFPATTARLSQDQYMAGQSPGLIGPPATSPPPDRWLGPPPTSGVGIPPATPGEVTGVINSGENRFQGRLRHGKGLPPGQRRNRFAQYQQGGGSFEPGWRKRLRQMQSMNGGGYQAQPQGGGHTATDDGRVLLVNPSLLGIPQGAGYQTQPGGEAWAQYAPQPPQFGGGVSFAPQGVPYGNDMIAREIPQDPWQNVFYGAPVAPRFQPQIPQSQAWGMRQAQMDPFSGPF